MLPSCCPLPTIWQCRGSLHAAPLPSLRKGAMTMTKIKVGVVGLGEIAQIIHLPILQAHSDKFEIAAICDISQELLTTLGDRYNVPAEYRYTDYNDLAGQ